MAVSARSSVVRAALETAVRSCDSLELAGAWDITLLRSLDVEGDVLLLDAGDTQPDRLAAFAGELPWPIVLLCPPSGAAFAQAALKSCIRGVLPADSTPEEIESAIQAVHSGLAVITPALLPARTADAQPVLDDLIEALTDRELEVLELIVEGLSNRLIAQRLGISEHTVKTHVGSIFSKLGVTSRTEAMSQAIRRGLVML